jgi:competence ComEA-like helix-hairpin-helix protein
MFCFTSQERRCIVFLAAVILIGVGFDFLGKKYATARRLLLLDPNIGKVELNSADENDLIALPGIGKTLAGRILQYRKEQGKFLQAEELKGIKGITESRFEKIKDHLYVR